MLLIHIKFMGKTAIILYTSGLLVCLAACNTKDARVKEYPKKIVGRWVLQQQTSVINAFNEEKKDTIVVDETKNYRDFSYKPAEVEYGTEGTYLFVLKDYNDDVKLRRAGLWVFNNDTLVLRTMDSTVTDRYVAELTDTAMFLKSKIDFDDDGKEDDSYTGYYKRVIR